ncbi:hypothetical protein BD311DRAFT_668039 [Dichomitus squalens]|uniref:Uncharacterized protein n=1 Tax=Dichomitus squalens TaxID=114155 RepID=A0A4V2JZV4_9APHY|nr:hypothetical protein BD311DRAFT_668039 [Dichomitus squalens]
MPKYTSIAWVNRGPPVTVDSTGTSSDYGPFANATQFRLVDHMYGRSDSKSLDAFDDLLSVVRSPGFSPADLAGFTARKAEHALDVWTNTSGLFSSEDGWHESSVGIPLPRTRAKYKSEDDAPKFIVPGIVHRRLLPLVKLAVQDPESHLRHVYHWMAHKRYWTPPPPKHAPSSSQPLPVFPQAAPAPAPSSRSSSTSQQDPPSPVRVYTDCYNADAMLEAEEEIRRKPRVPGDTPDMEYIVLPMLLWSDATQLSSFGSAALWPIYLYFGNLSKYFRGRPTEFMAHHLAYIPTVSGPHVGDVA